MSDTPSGRIIAAANKETEVTDVRGRKITVRQLGALDRARLFKAMGPANAQNVPYLGMTMLAASATWMDGVPLPFPTNDREIEAAIARLDDDGINAVTEVLVGNMQDDADTIAKKTDEALAAAAAMKEKAKLDDAGVAATAATA
jgi:hypothetical protein